MAFEFTKPLRQVWQELHPPENKVNTLKEVPTLAEEKEKIYEQIKRAMKGKGHRINFEIEEIVYPAEIMSWLLNEQDLYAKYIKIDDKRYLVVYW